MSIHIRNAAIGLAVAILIEYGLHSLGIGGFPASFAGPFLGVFVWYLLSNLSSNRKVKAVPDAERNTLIDTPPLAGCGLVYIYREGFVGMAVGIECIIDATTLTQLKAPRFTRVEVPAGSHILTAALKGFVGAQNRPAAVSFAIRDGETQVFLLKIAMGLADNKIQILPQPDTRLALAKLRAVTMVAPESSLPIPPPAAVPPPLPKAEA